MAWCLVKHREKFTFFALNFSLNIYKSGIFFQTNVVDLDEM
jgi:hypothetical protein